MGKANTRCHCQRTSGSDRYSLIDADQIPILWAGSLVAVLAALGRQLLRRAHPDVPYAYALASVTLLAAAPAVIAAALAALTSTEASVAHFRASRCKSRFCFA